HCHTSRAFRSSQRGVNGILTTIRSTSVIRGVAIISSSASRLLAHRVRIEAGLQAELSIGDRRDLRGLDLASAAPEHIGIRNIDARLSEMRVDRALMGQQQVLVEPVSTP